VFHQYSWAGGIDRNVANFKDAKALRAWAAPAVAVKPPAAPSKPAAPAKPPAPSVPTLQALAVRVSAVEAEVKALQARVK
jgi:hypothetical protein